MRVVWGGSTAILFTEHEQITELSKTLWRALLRSTHHHGILDRSRKLVNAGWNGLTHSTTRR